jgi:serine/threonine protein kinase/Flp pilus assembly protein TadD
MSFPQAQPGSLTSATAESLAAKLVSEMIERWGQGERLLAEDFLARHPALWEHPESAADLIYEELQLREQYGLKIKLEELLQRFPQWRRQLELLFDCQRLLADSPAVPEFPAAGDSLGDFQLLAELGRGAQGRVFLARQFSLGDRPVVLKITPAEADDYLSLARLQHTHIVPLHSVQDHPTRGLRAMCMPYFGSATLAKLLESLASKPPSLRTGQDILDELDRAQAVLPVGAPVAGPTRQRLTKASYGEIVCWIGACLADALQYAHERGLVHLDLKPSNILLAADGQPMLLDFHLARGPIDAEASSPGWLGGTDRYMSPEQREALDAIQEGRKVPRPVDGRSDLYSLAVVLYELLAGELPADGENWRPLNRCNSHVSIGLAEVIGKCLSSDPDRRYPQAAGLAVDLRRHLAHLPLQGVRNHSLGERWQKWRRRRPQGAALLGMIVAILAAAGVLAYGIASHFQERIEQARLALKDGQAQMEQGEWETAISTLQRGQSRVQAIPFQQTLTDELDHKLFIAQQAQHAARRASAVRELHQLIERLRFFYGVNSYPLEELRGLEACCRGFWENRGRIVERLNGESCPDVDPAIRDDLLDLAIFSADLQARLALPSDKIEARQRALIVLDEAEAMFGPSAVLDQEREIHVQSACDASGSEQCSLSRRPLGGPTAGIQETAWQHYALARSYLRLGSLERATEEAARAVRLEPQGLWPNSYLGLCAYRQGRYLDAALAYSVCIGAAPEAAVCFANRGLALDALGRTEEAFHDYDRALRLEPALGVAALNRGILHYRLRHYNAALDDLHRARELGANPALVAVDLALVHLARGEKMAALQELCRTLTQPPSSPADTRTLQKSVRK